MEWDKVTALYEVEDWKESTMAYFKAVKFQEIIYLLTAERLNEICSQFNSRANGNYWRPIDTDR
jgi:hypothetical protein